MNKPSFRSKDVYILILILLLALIFRLYRVNAPLADLHSWRQADTAAVGRNFVRDGIDLLHPRYDDLSGRESGKENPQGYRMVEFPFYNAIFAVSYKLAPFLAIEVHGRLITILFSLLLIAIIYFLLLEETSRLSAIVGSLSYAVLPFFVFFSRVVLPETSSVSLMFLSILFLYLYSRKKSSPLREFIYLSSSMIFFSLSLLVKPTVIFYSTVLIFLLLKKFGRKSFKKLGVYIYFIAGLVPFLLWRMYIKNYPEGIPAAGWLITSVNTYQGLKNIFLHPAFFRWIFFERLNNMIFGGYLSLFFLLGVLGKKTKLLFHSLLIGATLYLFVFQGGNVQHEYYQTIILPSIAIFLGLGVDFLWSLRRNFSSQALTATTTLVIFVVSFFFSYYAVKDFYNVPNDLTTIAKIIKTVTRQEDKIITDRSGDTTLLYLADRKGWPAYSGNLEVLKTNGYKYFVTSNKELILQFINEGKFNLFFENDQFTIFSL